jgi:hypothetical protein
MKMRAVILCSNPEPLSKLRKTLRAQRQFELVGACQTMPDVIECIQRHAPEVLLLDGQSPIPASRLAVKAVAAQFSSRCRSWTMFRRLAMRLSCTSAGPVIAFGRLWRHSEADCRKVNSFA